MSRAWADETGRNALGVVVIEDEQIFGSRQVQKTDARRGDIGRWAITVAFWEPLMDP